jgi:hypothetical protein
VKRFWPEALVKYRRIVGDQAEIRVETSKRNVGRFAFAETLQGAYGGEARVSLVSHDSMNSTGKELLDGLGWFDSVRGKRQNNINPQSPQNMRTFRTRLAVALCAAVLLAGTTVRAADKTYQVTGPILELTATSITVQKGDEKWQIARSGDTKVTGDLKIGAKVTIYYKMVATDVEVKAGKTDTKKK